MKLRLNIIMVLLIMASMLICLTTIMMYGAIDENNMINRISRGYYGEYATHFKFIDEKDENIKKIITLLKNEEYKDFALIYDGYEAGVRQIYIKGNYDSPPMLRGRFLTEDDFFNNKDLAVIGKDLLKDTYIADGKEVILIDNKQFEIIGVMGYSSASILDKMKVVNFDSLMKNYNNNIYIMDGYSRYGKVGVRKTMDKITELLKGGNIGVEVLDIKPIDTNRLLGMNINTSLVFGLLIICFLLCIYNIYAAWFHHNIRLIGIMKLVGWDIHRIRYYIFIRLFLYSIVGTILGIILSHILKIKIRNNIIIFHILLINLTFLILSMLPTLRRTEKVSVAEVIK